VIVGFEEILSRGREHFDSVLNFCSAAPCSQLEDQATTALPNGDVNTNALTIEEIHSSITRLKYDHATGLGGIPVAPELLHHAIGPISVGLFLG